MGRVICLAPEPNVGGNTSGMSALFCTVSDPPGLGFASGPWGVLCSCSFGSHPFCCVLLSLYRTDTLLGGVPATWSLGQAAN